jgi:hypothetical protein
LPAKKLKRIKIDLVQTAKIFQVESIEKIHLEAIDRISEKYSKLIK